MFVEEEEILDLHQRPPLAYAAEEAINNASSEIGVKFGAGCRPDAGADHDAREEERGRQAPKETSKSDDEEATRSNGEDVADNGALHGRLHQMPLAMMTRLLIASSLHIPERCMNVDPKYIDCGMTVIIAVPPV